MASDLSLICKQQPGESINSFSPIEQHIRKRRNLHTYARLPPTTPHSINTSTLPGLRNLTDTLNLP